jgi:heme A synthase
VLRNYKDEPALREPALILIVLLLVQVILGAMTVWTGKAAEVATAHVAAGALVLAATLVLGLWTFRLYDVPAAHASVTFVQEATAHS